MKDISNKVETLREATAEAYIHISSDLLKRVDYGRETDKGDALECSRIAGIMGAKQTWEHLPFCHPIPITYANIRYDVQANGIHIFADVKTLASTGVEMEALCAASTCALSLYDMLKPHAAKDIDEIEIQNVRLVSKKGGKSDHKLSGKYPVKAAVLVISNAVASGKKDDTAGQAVQKALQKYAHVNIGTYTILPDDADKLRASVQDLVARNTNLLITVGGTGLTTTDITVDTIQPMLDREIPGIMEAARKHGQNRTPHAMFSRGIAGQIGATYVVTFPGSTRGARETCDVLLPHLLHLFERP